MRLYANDMTPEERVRTTVYLDGADVTDDTVAVDDDEGWVAVVDRDAWQRRRMRGLPPLTRRYGRVRIEFGDETGG